PSHPNGQAVCRYHDRGSVPNGSGAGTDRETQQACERIARPDGSILGKQLRVIRGRARRIFVPVVSFVGGNSHAKPHGDQTEPSQLLAEAKNAVVAGRKYDWQKCAQRLLTVESESKEQPSGGGTQYAMTPSAHKRDTDGKDERSGSQNVVEGACA